MGERIYNQGLQDVQYDIGHAYFQGARDVLHFIDTVIRELRNYIQNLKQPKETVLVVEGEAQKKVEIGAETQRKVKIEAESQRTITVEAEVVSSQSQQKQYQLASQQVSQNQSQSSNRSNQFWTNSVEWSQAKLDRPVEKTFRAVQNAMATGKDPKVFVEIFAKDPIFREALQRQGSQVALRYAFKMMRSADYHMRQGGLQNQQGMDLNRSAGQDPARSLGQDQQRSPGQPTKHQTSVTTMANQPASQRQLKIIR
jgi:hypothetical protein